MWNLESIRVMLVSNYIRFPHTVIIPSTWFWDDLCIQAHIRWGGHDNEPAVQVHPPGSRRRGQSQSSRVLRGGLLPLPLVPLSFLLSPLQSWNGPQHLPLATHCHGLPPSPRSCSSCPHSGKRGESHALFISEKGDDARHISGSWSKSSQASWAVRAHMSTQLAAHSPWVPHAPSFSVTHVSLVILHTQTLYAQVLGCLSPWAPNKTFHTCSVPPTLMATHIQRQPKFVTEGLEGWRWGWGE